MTAGISQAAVDLIVAAEVSSRAYYEKHYRGVEWPGEQSGVTIAIGYDVGYATPEKLRSDFKARIPDEMIEALVPCCGVRGGAASRLIFGLQGKIDVPWQVAMEVFLRTDVPAWIAKVCAAIPRADKLSPDCLGALVSLAYNRGASFNIAGPRYDEMRAIRAMIGAGKLEGVADQIRAMKRLWPNTRGLRDRRDAEAALWDKGLKSSAPAAAQPQKTEAPKPIAPKPKPGAAEHGPAGGIVVGGGAAANNAAHSGASAGQVLAILAVTAALALGLWIAIRWWRSQPTLARAKG